MFRVIHTRRRPGGDEERDNETFATRKEALAFVQELAQRWRAWKKGGTVGKEDDKTWLLRVKSRAIMGRIVLSEETDEAEGEAMAEQLSVGKIIATIKAEIASYEAGIRLTEEVGRTWPATLPYRDEAGEQRKIELLRERIAALEVLAYKLGINLDEEGA